MDLATALAEKRGADLILANDPDAKPAGPAVGAAYPRPMPQGQGEADATKARGLAQADVIQASVDEVVETLFITLILVVLTVYVFLQSFRATSVPLVTIPVSLIGTFAVMAVMGFSLNTLTLFGLVLAIGIVVDDAIVVVENVERKLEEGAKDGDQDESLVKSDEVEGKKVYSVTDAGLEFLEQNKSTVEDIFDRVEETIDLPAVESLPVEDKPFVNNRG